MSKRFTKLSRPKAKNSQLNNSDEDFQSVLSEEKPNVEISEISEIAPPPEIEIPIPPCPFCGKSFQSGITRSSHLKSCGNHLGVDTNQLLEIKKLEEKQAEEWKALNLPKTNNVTVKNTTKNSTKVDFDS